VIYLENASEMHTIISVPHQ